MKKLFRFMCKIMILLIIVGILAALVSLLINSYVRNMAAKSLYSYNETEKIDSVYDAVVILGAMVYSDTSVSGILADRLKIGLDVYEKGLARKIIVSGDHGDEGYNEVIAMKLYLMDRGVPREDIFMDHAGFNTYDSMYRAKNIFCAERIIVVTQQFHLFRAVYIGNALGMETVGVNSDLTIYGNMRYNNVREYFARNKAFIDTEIFRRPSKHIGDKISVLTGDGRDTEDERSKEIFASKYSEI